MTLPDGFLARVEMDAAGCWLWTGGVTGGGYGYYWAEGRMRRAHRYAYEAVVGPIPDGMDLDHLCRVRTCVNPDHLEPVTRRENLLRGATTVALAALGVCRRGIHIGDAHVYEAASGKRHCKSCARDRRVAR